MSHAPQILISEDHDVLRQIRDPFTHAVCWKITGEEAQALSEHAKICDPFYKEKHFSFEPIQAPHDVAASDEALCSFTRKLMPLIESIVLPMAPHHNTTTPFNVRYMKAGGTYRDTNVPHVDGEYLQVFYSFNDHMQSTRCIPQEHAGKCSNALKQYLSADISKAISFPGMSVSIIDLVKQVHMSPPSVPPERGRIMHTKAYRYG